jgi:hypothetical protein
MRKGQKLQKTVSARSWRRIAFVVATTGAVVVSLFTSGQLAGAAAAKTAANSTTTTVTNATTTPTLQRGAFVLPGNPAALGAFDTTTGTQSTIASDYLPTAKGWSGMDGSGGSLSWMLARGWSGSGYTLSLGVPIIPTGSSGTPVGTLAVGATGAYDRYFVTLGQTLVADGEANADLRLGWEFTGTWYPWTATTPTSEAHFAAYFAQIVTAMRTVPGENFKFVWNPSARAFTTNAAAVEAAYPGNAFVDYIGLDSYDTTWRLPHTPATAWSQTTLPALTAALNFADAMGKPLAMTEWGLATTAVHGLGDDPLYVASMIDWLDNPAHHVAYESYFDTDLAAITGGNYPKGLAAFVATWRSPNPSFSGLSVISVSLHRGRQHVTQASP